MLQVQLGLPAHRGQLAKPVLPVLSDPLVPRVPLVRPVLQVQLGLPARRGQLVKPVLPVVYWAMQISTP